MNIAIFASGAGSNAKTIMEFFQKHSTIKISLVVCNKPKAGVLQHAISHDVPVLLIEKELFFSGDAYLPQLKNAAIDFIVLAGFLWKIPQQLVDAYPNRIINIHPALLPDFGGKGMFGEHVHKAVIASEALKSGISIHYVDEKYDNGDIIFQAFCSIDPGETPETLANKIHKLEHQFYPRVIEQCALKAGTKIKLTEAEL